MQCPDSPRLLTELALGLVLGLVLQAVDTFLYSAVQCNASGSRYISVQYSTPYSTVQYTVEYSTVQYSTVEYSIVKYSTVQYSTVFWILDLGIIQQVFFCWCIPR